MTRVTKARWVAQFALCGGIMVTGILFDSGRDTDQHGRTIWNYGTYGEQHVPDHWCAPGESPIPGARDTYGDCLVPFPDHFKD